ncbi:hypothetical protein TR13x_06825 [Caloranaerobacter sp. TR13]|uniref:ZIP family metal transporter n=1 Tax=Caloranaerobacter sp. TR13 TaxID=1302151 RepID=UPI0006D43DA0|nr:ZIP family metal transporter [Caloranaerobacter sp. TR13]KPU27100.1 hypothetical protein TR13x_06825 [Caloranaerobacter sp. TR13]
MQGILVSILVGLCTGVGALPFLFIKKVPQALKDGLLGFASGIMVFASSFNLIQPALKDGNLLSVIGGIIIGTMILTFIEHLIPHTHTKNYDENDDSSVLKKNILLAIAVAIHNVPEGFAIGVGYGTGNVSTGLSLALAIGVQNIPEGLVVAAPLIEGGYPRGKALLFSFLTGIGEPIAAAIGFFAARLTDKLLPFILSIAAGAMFYVVSHELIPESHCNNNEMLATYGFIIGLILMIIFRTVIGE